MSTEDYNEVDHACAKFLEENDEPIGSIELGYDDWTALRASVNGSRHIRIIGAGKYEYAGVPIVLVESRSHLKVVK